MFDMLLDNRKESSSEVLSEMWRIKFVETFENSAVIKIKYLLLYSSINSMTLI